MVDELRKNLLDRRDTELAAGDDGSWCIDMEKCTRSNEAIFQRTIMMSLFDRHGLGDFLDYTCEETWQSDAATSMPTWGSPDIQLAKPKPDLTVAFKTFKLLPPGHDFEDLNCFGGLLGHLCPEGDKKEQVQRAMHFFSVETKGKLGKIENSEAEFQNLNTASTALHNIYMIMRDVDETRAFFRDVRFFSVAATVGCFEIRVHRGYRVSGSSLLDATYPVGYRFDTLIKLAPGVMGADYTRDMTTRIVYNILFRYGVGKLRPLLMRCLEKVLAKRGGPNFRHVPLQSADTQAQSFASVSSGAKRAADDVTQSFNSNASRQRRRVQKMGIS
jgi:hypothetical protein